jgi:hypothetical protein
MRPVQLKPGQGIRIYHPTLRNASFIFTRPPSTPQGAWRKAPITIDGDGYALVSEGVWGDLTRSKMSGFHHDFVIVNAINNPPPLLLGFNGEADYHRRTYEQVGEALTEIAPAGVVAKTIEHPVRVHSL